MCRMQPFYAVETASNRIVSLFCFLIQNIITPATDCCESETRLSPGFDSCSWKYVRHADSTPLLYSIALLLSLSHARPPLVCNRISTLPHHGGLSPWLFVHRFPLSHHIRSRNSTMKAQFFVVIYRMALLPCVVHWRITLNSNRVWR